MAGLLIVIAGFGVVALSLMGGGHRGDAQVKGGAVVMIGPIPIIFGSDAKWASVAIVLAIVLVVLTLLVGLV